MLLPAAKIDMHVRDASLRDAVALLQADWRFARVGCQLAGDSLDTAIQLYAHQESPDLLLIETDDISAQFTDRLNSLAAVCHAETACVIIGPVNDVYVYRQLIAMGVSDYLVKPIAATALADVVAQALTTKKGQANSKLLAVIGSKGGVGTSSCARMIADLLAHHDSQKTVLLDAAGGWSYSTVAHGHEPVATLSEAARAALSADADSFKRLLVPTSATLSLLGTGVDALLSDPVTPAAMESILDKTLQQTPMVVADLSSANGAVSQSVLARADRVIVVSTPTLPALRGARSLLQEIRTLRGNDAAAIDVVINMAGRWGKVEIGSRDITQALGIRVSAVVPDAPHVFSILEGVGENWRHQKGVAELQSALLPLLHPFLQNAGAVSASSATGKKQNFISNLLKGQR
ncbi:MAG: AAA family ATPase [Pseudomonadota bacterium]